MAGRRLLSQPNPPPPTPPTPPPTTGAQLIAHTLRSLDITIVFGIVGIPIIEVAEACVATGIRFVGFRNEQAASYAASAYGYLTGRPGVLLVVGGPGVVHALAGVHGSQQNHFPLLLLSGSHHSTHLPTRGSFQSLSTTTFLAPHTKLALRAPTPTHLPQCIREAYRTAFWGRPGAAAVEINGDYVTYKLSEGDLGSMVHEDGRLAISPVSDSPTAEGDRKRVRNLASMLANSAKRPLLVIGKGAAYSRCEGALSSFVSRTSIPFLPTPMGKGLLPSSHPLDVSAARSLALKGADLIILLGARLNWILHFGEPPKLAPNIQIAKIDISPEELGRNLAIPGVSSSAQGEELSIVGDCGAVLVQLIEELNNVGWEGLELHDNPWLGQLKSTAESSVLKLHPKLYTPTPQDGKLTYHRTFHLLHQVLAELSVETFGGNPQNWADNVVLVSEGANTMDISRSVFPISKPRQRLDAGTDATMGVGMGYAIASWCAYNLPPLNGTPGEDGKETPIPGAPKRKKVVAIEGDSAFGFSAMEIETMARYHMDIVVIVINNGGIYRGIEYTGEGGSESRGSVISTWSSDPRRDTITLPTTALSHHTQYATLGNALGAKGFQVWGVGDGSDANGGVEAELVRKVREAWKASEGELGASGEAGKRNPVVVDVEIESGAEKELVFAWLGGEKGKNTDPRL